MGADALLRTRPEAFGHIVAEGAEEVPRFQLGLRAVKIGLACSGCRLGLENNFTCIHTNKAMSFLLRCVCAIALLLQPVPLGFFGTATFHKRVWDGKTKHYSTHESVTEMSSDSFVRASGTAQRAQTPVHVLDTYVHVIRYCCICNWICMYMDDG